MRAFTVAAPWLAIFGLLVAYLVYQYVKKQPNGNETMQKIEGMIHAGAMAFLKKEYSVLVFFIAAVFVLLWLVVDSKLPAATPWTAIAFVTGARLDAVQNTPSGELIGLYVPTTPIPTSGYLVYVPESQVVRLDMTVDEGLKIVLSGGLVVPPPRVPG